MGDKEYFQMKAHMYTIATEREVAADVTALWCQGRKEGVSDSFTLVIIIIIIIMYIYHALINALSAHMIHINLNMIF